MQEPFADELELLFVCGSAPRSDGMGAWNPFPRGGEVHSAEYTSISLSIDKVTYGSDRVAPESRQPNGFRAFNIGISLKGKVKK